MSWVEFVGWVGIVGFVGWVGWVGWVEFGPCTKYAVEVLATKIGRLGFIFKFKKKKEKAKWLVE